MMDTVELAAQFIRRGGEVLANDILKDECGVEYKIPAQVQFYAIHRDHVDAKVANESLKWIAEMYGCVTYMEQEKDSSMLTIVGEDDAIVTLREVWRLARSDEYGYEAAMKPRVWEANICGKGREVFRKWSDDYILGFFEGLAGDPDTEHLSRFSKHPRVLGILDGFNSVERYEKGNK